MDTKDVLYQLRSRKGLSQDALAEKLHVTRQAISRWETGETTPNIDTLKQLSRLYDVSINTLLGSPRKLVCQCCGMPLEDSILSREPDGNINEDYCQWCYAEGEFVYKDMESLLAFCATAWPMTNGQLTGCEPIFPKCFPRLLLTPLFRYNRQDTC